jgi:hypothetical protein
VEQLEQPITEEVVALAAQVVAVQAAQVET